MAPPQPRGGDRRGGRDAQPGGRRRSAPGPRGSHAGGRSGAGDGGAREPGRGRSGGRGASGRSGASRGSAGRGQGSAGLRYGAERYAGPSGGAGATRGRARRPDGRAPADEGKGRRPPEGRYRSAEGGRGRPPQGRRQPDQREPRPGDRDRDRDGNRDRDRDGNRDRDRDRDRDGDRRRAESPLRGPREWGGLARRGAGQAAAGASDAWRAAAPERQKDAWAPEEWIDEGELRDEASEAVGRSRSGERPPAARRGAAAKAGAAARDAGPDDGRPRRARSRRPADRTAAGADAPADDVRRAVPANRVERFEARLREASDAFRRERYEDARRILRPLAEQAPSASSVRELYGLTLYRLGRWAQAVRELEAFRTQTGSTEQHPVLADSYRALGRYAEVEELWEELRAESPSAELVAEGRIVAAGALADQGRLPEAIRLLEAAPKRTGRPKLHHLRIAYALADLYERAGELPRARELFGLVADADPDFVDIQARLRALR
jgi:tetratricopeptide (TPR) repeat protein